MAASGSSSWGELGAWAEKARKTVLEQAQATYETVQQGSVGDLELGEGTDRWASWAKGAAERARQSVTQVAGKAAAADWSEQAKAWQGDLAHTLGKVTETAAKAGAGLSEHAKAAQQKAALVAGSAKEKLEKAGSGTLGALSGMSALAMSPAKLLQFAGMFMVGLLLVSMSFSFLPILPLKPQKFALLFALGSVTMLGSVAWLKGPAAFASVALQREKLPFSAAYGAGLVGTFWATLIERSYIFTAIFALMQAVGLLYFLASFVPGGKAVLNFFGRCGRRAASALFRRR